MSRTYARANSFVLVGALLVAMVPIGPVGAGANGIPAVKIAVAVPISAGATMYGTGARDGVKLAVADYASALAAAGVTVTVDVRDDQGDPSVAVANANVMVADSSIVGVVGHVNSGCSIPASTVYAAHSLAMVSPSSTSLLLTQRGLTNVFRTVANDTKQGSSAADIAFSKLRLSKAYVVDDSTEYGEMIANGFRARFKALAGTVVGSSHTSDSQTNFSSLVARIKAKKPAVVFYGGFYVAGSQLTKQLKSAGVSAVFISDDGILDREFVRLTGATRAAGAIATNVGYPVDEMPGGLLFRSRYTTAFGHAERTLYDAYAYDAAQAILKAIILVANRDGAAALNSPSGRELVRAEVAKSSFYGVTGRIGFYAAGDTRYPAIGAFRVKNGLWRECALVGKPVLSSAPHAGVSFKVSGELKPKHAPGALGAKLRFWRLEGGAWILHKTVSAYASNSGVFSKYSARVKLSGRGKWRVSAEHSDGLHPAMRSFLKAFTLN